MGIFGTACGAVTLLAAALVAGGAGAAALTFAKVGLLAKFGGKLIPRSTSSNAATHSGLFPACICASRGAGPSSGA